MSIRFLIPARTPIALASIAAVVLLSGCTPFTEYVHNGFKVGPNYQQPPAPVAPSWIDAADSRVRSGVRRSGASGGPSSTIRLSTSSSAPPTSRT